MKKILPVLLALLLSGVVLNGIVRETLAEPISLTLQHADIVRGAVWNSDETRITRITVRLVGAMGERLTPHPHFFGLQGRAGKPSPVSPHHSPD